MEVGSGNFRVEKNTRENKKWTLKTDGLEEEIPCTYEDFLLVCCEFSRGVQPKNLRACSTHKKTNHPERKVFETPF